MPSRTKSVHSQFGLAFDIVWRNGLKLKMHQCGIAGLMYRWIYQYLIIRKARVQNKNHHSRKKILKQDVPQGGVLSPTLFIIFINDILKDILRWIHGAIYADDLVIATGRYFTNYKAEAQALETAATMLVEQREVIQNKVVIFSDALPVRQALSNPKTTNSTSLPVPCL